MVLIAPLNYIMFFLCTFRSKSVMRGSRFEIIHHLCTYILGYMPYLKSERVVLLLKYVSFLGYLPKSSDADSMLFEQIYPSSHQQYKNSQNTHCRQQRSARLQRVRRRRYQSTTSAIVGDVVLLRGNFKD